MTACLEPELDRYPVKSTRPSKMAIATRALCSDLNLFDTWKILNPKVKVFIFFSRPHNSFSRIDYFFTSRQALERVKTCSIKAMTPSDHSLVCLELTPPYYDPATRHWWLNPSLLSNPTFLTLLEEQLKFFFSTNDTPDVSASTLWESAKAYIRGVIISYTSAKRKEALRQQLELESQISDLEKEFKHSANKPGRLLARLAKGRADPNVIPSLKDDRGAKHYVNKHMVNIMKCFYQNLYSSESPDSAGDQAKFLDHIDLPTLSAESRDLLCRPVTKEEVYESIKSLPGGKALGPDGFCPEFYKKMAKMIVEPLTRMYTVF